MARKRIRKTIRGVGKEFLGEGACRVIAGEKCFAVSKSLNIPNKTLSRFCKNIADPNLSHFQLSGYRAHNRVFDDY